MAGRPLHRLILATAVLAFGSPAAAQTVIYSDSSSEDKLQSKVAVAVEEGAFSLQADMTMVGKDGQTKVLPRVTSAWTGLDFLDVRTVFLYDDWNQAADPFEPTVETSVLYQSGFSFIDRIEGNLRRTGDVSNETVKVKFAGVDTGLRLFGGDAFGVNADLTMRDGGNRPQTDSSITSSLGVGRAIDVKAILRLENGASSYTASQTFDTKLVYDSPVAFIDEFEGGLYRSASGDTRQSLALRFPEITSGEEYGTSFKISSKAILEELMRADGFETVSMGVETKFSGFRPPLIGGSNALSFRVERQFDAAATQTSSLAYDHSWSPGATSIGLNFKMLRDPDDIAPSMGLTWMTQF